MRSAPVSEEAASRGRVKKPSPGRTPAAGRRLRPAAAVGIRRSPRAHTQTVTTTASNDERSDEESGPETVVNDDNEVAVDVQMGEESPQVTAEKSPAKSPSVTSDDDYDGKIGDVDADDGDDADEVVDVVENDKDDDSTTRSLSASLSPYESQPVEIPHPEEHETPADWLTNVGVHPDDDDATADWLCDADATRNSLLFDADGANSVSSEADSVDVVDDRAVTDLRDGSPALLVEPYDADETQLQELEQFVNRSTDEAASAMESTDDIGGKTDGNLSSGSSHSFPQLIETSEPVGSPRLAATTAGPTHTADVRRGAMWRDSLFPSDFPPEPTSVSAAGSEMVCGKPMSTGKPGGTGKPDARGSKAAAALSTLQRMGWDVERQHIDVDVLSAHSAERQSVQSTSSSSQTCRPSFPHSTPPISSPQYQYAGKSLELPGSSGFRYNSGRHSVSDVYSHGSMYDVANASTQRPSSVRPGAAATAAGVDAHRLSHVWPGAPLPAHQHHVSLSHLQHLVPDDFQYAAAPALATSVSATAPVGHSTSSSQNAAAEFARPCQQTQPQQRQHGSSRTQHKTHHKPTASSTNQPVPPSLTAAAAAGYDMFSACRIQQPLGYFPHQGAAAALPMGVVGLHHAQMVAAAANFGQPMPAGQAANSAMYSAAAAAAYSYLNGGGLQPFNVDINSVMRR